MKIKLIILLVFFGTMQITQPMTVTIVHEHHPIGDIMMAGFVLCAGILGVDSLLDLTQKWCQKKVKKIKDLQKESTHQDIITELNNRAFNFKVLNGLLYIPRIATVSGMLAIPVLTLLSIGSELEKLKK